MTSAATPREAAEGWIAEYAPIFGGTGIELREVWVRNPGRGKTYFAYQQFIDGLPVANSVARVMVLNGEPARVAYAAAIVTPHPQEPLPLARITGPQAVARAQADERTRGVTTWSEPEQVVWCGEEWGLNSGAARTWVCHGSGSERFIQVYVDAVSGEVRAVYDTIARAFPAKPSAASAGAARVDQVINGTVSGFTMPALLPFWGGVSTACPEDEEETGLPGVRIEVMKGEGFAQVHATAFTGSGGTYTVLAPENVEVKVRATLRGPNWGVFDCSGPSQVFYCDSAPPPPVAPMLEVLSEAVTAPETVLIEFDLPGSEPARERAIAQHNAHQEVWRFMNHLDTYGILPSDAPFLHVWAAHVAHAGAGRAIYTNSSALPAVGFATAFTASAPNPNEPNMAFSTVVAHECGHYYGHMILGFNYIGNQEFHEGLGDSFGTLVHDTPIIGENALGCGAEFRNLSDPECLYPACPDSHQGRCTGSGALGQYDRGEVLGAAWWNTRLELDDIEAARTLHADWSLITIGQQSGAPGCTTSPQAAGPWTLVEALVADDNDADLSNGTPHENEICQGFAEVCISPDIDIPLCAKAEFPAACSESAPGRPCYADCDQATGIGILDVFDFQCFQSKYATREAYACNCDLSSGWGVCDIFDFLCFQREFDAGCR